MLFKDESLHAYRFRGLVVDEDFELGISPVERMVRTGLLAAIVVLLAGSTAWLLMPERGSTALQQRTFPSLSHPANVRPLPAVALKHRRATA